MRPWRRTRASTVCTELPMILRDAGDLGVPLLDTGALHVEALVTRMLS